MGVLPGKTRRASRIAVLTLAAILSALTNTLQAQAADPVQWVNAVLATPSGSTVQKTGGCGTCADAGATSAQSLVSGDGFIEFVPLAGARLYAGLGSNATANTDPALINFAFSFWPDGGWDVREKNVYKTEGRFVSGDVFRVAIVSGRVQYYQNGAMVYASALAPSYPLVFDTTLIGAGATVANATISGSGPVATKVGVVVSATTLPDGAIAQPYSAMLQASGGNGTYIWSLVSGSLPPGIALSPAGALSGTPASAGTFSFVARATDALDAANFAERTFAIAVPASQNAITIQSASVPSTRLAASYSTTLRAAGGSGAYRWGIVSGALPAGLSLDTTGTIQGIPAAAGRFSVTVRAADATDGTNFSDRSVTVTVLAEAPPSVYDAIADRTTRTKPPLPALSGAGYAFNDPAFGTRLVRITDGNTRPGALNRSYRTPSSSHANAWSADARYFYTVSTDGTVIPYSFDRSTMRASRLQASTTADGGLTLRFFNEPTFSYLTPGVLYGTYNGTGSNLRSVDQYDIETGLYKQLINLDTLGPNLTGTYTGGLGVSAGTTEKVFAFFGGASQDRHFYLVVFDKDNPGNHHLVDTLASTVDGVPTNVVLNLSIHAANIDRSGRFVSIYSTGADQQAPRSAAPVYVWDTATNVFTALPLAAARTGGHDGYGYGVRVNQDCCTASTWDAAQWQFRLLDAPLTTWDLISPVVLPKEVYLADHPSWHNAQPDRLVPFIDANYRYGLNATAWRAWDEEVLAVQTEAAGTGGMVWRFAHHRSNVADDADASRISFWYTPRANVSPDGQWALFTSNWEKTLGTDPRGEVGGTFRQDVFLVELQRTLLPPPPPPPPPPAPSPVAIATTALPSGQVTQPYSASLTASGGSGSYTWSIRAGTLPAGLSLNAATGAVAGTPAASGVSTFTIRATDAADATNFADAIFSITIAPQPTASVTITTTTLPEGYLNVAYSISLAASAGTAPLKWTIVSGSLPSGLALNATTGVISGAPTSMGSSSFSVRVMDSATPATSSTKTLTLRIRKK